MAAAVRIQSECALTYMNASSGQNLSAVRTAQVNAGAHAVESCGALDRCQGQVRSLRTNVTCVWGRERPAPTRLWGEEGGMAGRVAHAPLAANGGDDRAVGQHPRQRAPLVGSGEVADVNDLRGRRRLVAGFSRAEASSANCVQQGGTVLPSFRSPTLFPIVSRKRELLRIHRSGAMICAGPPLQLGLSCCFWFGL
jgi:hypothetical protein